MDDLLGINWVSYFHCLSNEEIRELASWLAAECLEVWELMDIVDRVYAQAPDDWRRRSPAFVTRCGRPVVEGYARRKRRFAELMTALDEACLRGALPGEVALEELRPLHLPGSKPRPVEDLLGELERARSSSG
ncbi:MAG TPA: hypothetical protein VKQ30_14540 [Ktedonobacterales bacterium]|nr:hypothetical protein [Ktedonobacterales bacterium]